MMRKIAADAAAVLLLLSGLVLLLGEVPGAGFAAFAAYKAAGLALLWAAGALAERSHPEWREEDV